MKKVRTLSLFVVLIITLFTMIISTNATNIDDIEIKMTVGTKVAYVNSNATTLDVAPIIRNSRTMLPVRFVAETFGAEVSWDATTSTATINSNDIEISITIGANNAIINGKSVSLDSPAFIENGRTYLPVRIVAETLGATVQWDAATSTATLTLKGEDVSGDFHILVSGNYSRKNNTANDFVTSEKTADQIDVAVYNRYNKFKQDYGVNLITDFQVNFDSCNGRGIGFNKVYTEYMSGESTYDAAMIGAYDVASLAYSGLLYDLNSVPNLDITKNYWDQKANSDLTIMGKTFYITGDISITNDMVTSVIFFNKELKNQYNLDNPYDYVRKNQWTLETFYDLVRCVYGDLDHSGDYTSNDRYGLLTWDNSTIAILAGAGQKIADINSSGKLELSLSNDTAISIGKFLVDTSLQYSFKYDRTTEKNISLYQRMFYDNQSLFLRGILDDTSDFNGDDYGIVPYPKLNNSQENYYSLVSTYHSQFLCVPKLSKNVSRTGIILDRLAALGQETITATYYNKLSNNAKKDTNYKNMINTIISSQTYDIGSIYNLGSYDTQLRNILTSRESIATIYETYKSDAEESIEKINSAFSAQ